MIFIITDLANGYCSGSGSYCGYGSTIIYGQYVGVIRLIFYSQCGRCCHTLFIIYFQIGVYCTFVVPTDSLIGLEICV